MRFSAAPWYVGLDSADDFEPREADSFTEAARASEQRDSLMHVRLPLQLIPTMCPLPCRTNIL
jgi:hypothetical protein